MHRHLQALRQRLSYANVVATLALFVALGRSVVRGGDAAAQQRRRQAAEANAVTAKKIRNGAVTGPKLRVGHGHRQPHPARHHHPAPAEPQAARSRCPTPPGSEGLGPEAFARAGSRRHPTRRRWAASPASRYFRAGGTLPRGATVSGAFGGLVNAATRYDAVVSFPFPSPSAVTTESIRFAPGTVNAPPDRIDASCSGTLADPVAPAGAGLPLRRPDRRRDRVDPGARRRRRTAGAASPCARPACSPASRVRSGAGPTPCRRQLRPARTRAFVS